MKIKDYSKNPLMYLWKTNNSFLPKYAWITWLVITVLLLLLNNKGFVNTESLDANLFTILSFAGIGIVLVALPQATTSFSMYELELLLMSDSQDRKKDNQLLSLYAPYIYTLIIFLVVGTVSLISGYITINIDEYTRNTVNIIHVLFMLLGMFGLFNIGYERMNDKYYAVERSRQIRELNKVEEQTGINKIE